MVFAIAALLLQFGPAVPAVPAAAAAGASATKASTTAAARPAAAEPAPAADLPDAPLPPRATAGGVPSSDQPAGNSLSQTSQRSPAVLRAGLDASADNTQALSMIHIPETGKELPRISVDAVSSRRQWLALSIAQHSAATFDAYETRHALDNGAYEADPLMRPFAGSSGIYGAIQVCPLVLDFAATRMQRSENVVLRHTWWVPQSLGAGMYLFAGVHDLHVANEH